MPEETASGKIAKQHIQQLAPVLTPESLAEILPHYMTRNGCIAINLSQLHAEC